MFKTAPGAEMVITERVTEEMTALRVGSGSLRVLATPALIALMEGAACRLIEPLLEEGITTVGTRIIVDHKAATPVGSTITVRAVLEAVEDRKYVFSVRAEDEAGIAAEGHHERFSVRSERFIEKVNASHRKEE